ncbi:MAG: GTP cyclohydrolase II, partial [Myxococcota bacterium]
MAKPRHIQLTSHPGMHEPLPIRWGAAEPAERGPIIATLTKPHDRNVIGTHSGSYAVYRALAVAAGALDPAHRADLTNTSPWHPIGPHPQWSDPEAIVSFDPWGAQVTETFADLIDGGFDIRPSIAITKARLHMPELKEALSAGRLHADGSILTDSGEIAVTKAAVEPVWYLPAVAKRFGCEEWELRRTLFEQTGGMFPELVTRGDLEVFLPPIGGQTVYLFGDADRFGEEGVHTAVRVHDECNGSDV